MEKIDHISNQTNWLSFENIEILNSFQCKPYFIHIFKEQFATSYFSNSLKSYRYILSRNIPGLYPPGFSYPLIFINQNT